MQEQLEERLVRYVDEYGWNWGVVKRQINGFFGTNYSADDLKKTHKLVSARRKRRIYKL